MSSRPFFWAGACSRSSSMISRHKETHSSQIWTFGPAISLRTSRASLPQKEQRTLLFESVGFISTRIFEKLKTGGFLRISQRFLVDEKRGNGPPQRFESIAPYIKRRGASIYSPIRRRSYSSISPGRVRLRDRKSTRLNSSHVRISYAVFCL